MTIKVISGATQADADICNRVDPPTRGVEMGPGLHAVIPKDWLERCLAGETVPGCTYAKVEDGLLYVSDTAQERVADPNVTKDLPAKDVEDFKAKVDAADVTAEAEVALKP